MNKLDAKKIVFIGAGNMGEALVNGIIKGGVCPHDRVQVTDVREERLEHFEKLYGVRGTKDNTEAVKDAEIVVLAVKPQAMAEAIAGFKDAMPANALVISIAAGIPTARLEEMLGEGTRVVRVMPNTPSLIGEGAAAVCAGRNANEDDLRTAETVLGAVGLVVRVEETDMDAVTAVSGSGPAYVFYLIEALLEAADQHGLDPKVARDLACATVAGAAKLMIETGADAGDLRERVTSKGGTTAAALAVLHEGKVGETFVEAIKAAHQRSKELSGS